ncbi:hypothetical protein COR50_03525 [Chitinophaga caeni]|uniref:Uncharacterized protein n=1 Tax=Chitinophaga caeni TaxID=2029983 RepID=A0A291QQU9_9BACT|nr:hypothetical protein COR50_03525 [Chitinophaga caeni]
MDERPALDSSWAGSIFFSNHVDDWNLIKLLYVKTTPLRVVFLCVENIGNICLSPDNLLG